MKGQILDLWMFGDAHSSTLSLNVSGIAKSETRLPIAALIRHG